MKIAINTRLLLNNKMEGMGWFTYETCKYLSTHFPEHEFIFIFDRPFDKRFIFSSNITPVVVGPPARHPILWWIWFNVSIPIILKKIQPDVFFSPDGFIPLNTKYKTLAVIHDINFMHFKLMPFLHQKYYMHFFKKYAQKATRLATVSEFSKQDIVNTYDIDPEKIDVVYNGVNLIYAPVSQSTQEAIKAKYTQGQNYFVFVGGLYPRKNLDRLLLAFEQFKAQSQLPTKLLIIGKPTHYADTLYKIHAQLRYKEDITFLGRIDDNNLVRDILASSLAMVYVSIFEGFGIPIVEAMKCHVPVITSNNTAMKEIAEDAAILVEPTNINDIAQALYQMATNANLRTELIEKGKLVAEKYSSVRTAQLIWESLQKTIQKEN